MHKYDLAISHQFAAMLIFVFSFGIGLAAWLGYELASRKYNPINYAVHYADQEEIQKVNVVEKQYVEQIENLIKHIGRIEANLIRINALGAHLVEFAQLSPEEFNFDTSPAMGGPLINMEPASLINTIIELERQVEIRFNQLNTLNKILQFQRQHRELKFDSKGSPVKKGWISSYFGHRIDPITGQRAWHGGVDIVAPEGAPIKALASGIVTQSAERGAYGNLIEINHGNGLATRYGHNKKLLVKTGQLVKKGQTIALLGSTGRSTGPHVHLEVHKNGQSVDPGHYFPDLMKKS